jgi:hypothetical protein
MRKVNASKYYNNNLVLRIEDVKFVKFIAFILFHLLGALILFHIKSELFFLVEVSLKSPLFHFPIKLLVSFKWQLFHLSNKLLMSLKWPLFHLSSKFLMSLKSQLFHGHLMTTISFIQQIIISLMQQTVKMYLWQSNLIYTCHEYDLIASLANCNYNCSTSLKKI